MKITFLPKTKNGKRAIAAFIALLLLLGYFFLMVDVFGQRGGETFFSNLNLTIPMLLAWFSGLLSLIFGLIAIFSDKAYSILVIVVGLLSLFTTVYGVSALL